MKSLYKYLIVFLFLAAWEILCRLGFLNEMFIPAFTDILATTWDMAVHGKLLEHASVSLQRALLGFAAAVLAGIPLGFLAGGWFKKTGIALGPVFEVFSQTNPFILFHIIILFLGIGELPKITIIAWTCIWPIVFNTASGIRHTNSVLLKAGRGFGLGRTGLFRKIVLPAAAPSIFTGIRLSAGYSMFMLIAAEIMGSSSGLGWIIKAGEENYEIRKIFSAALVIAFFGLVVDGVMGFLQKRFFIRSDEGFLNSEY